MAKSTDNSLIDQHKRMAMGQSVEGQDDDFGVEKFKAGIPHLEGSSDAEVHGKHLTEAQRAMPKRGGKTGSVNHGPTDNEY